MEFINFTEEADQWSHPYTSLTALVIIRPYPLVEIIYLSTYNLWKYKQCTTNYVTWIYLRNLTKTNMSKTKVNLIKLGIVDFYDEVK